METGLKGKTALVTGAGKKDGIGFGIAESLAREGMNVILADLPVKQEHIGLSTGSMEATTQLVEELAKTYGVKTLAIGVDVSNMDSCLNMAAEVKKQFPVLHLLCNNAGVTLGAGQPMHMYEEKTWLAAIDVNLSGMFRVSKALIPLMTAGGSIINTASRAGKVPPPYNGAYAVSKAGVIMFTKVQAKELAQAKIRVNAICPGQIKTGMEQWRFNLEAKMLGTTPEIQEQAQIKTIPLGYIGSVNDVGNVVVFLASDAASYMTGQAVNITGGQLMEF
jgi:NAD(P)-dependent dehydrogenase (short-subunit alcohol dehydrogenase family)